MSDNNAHSSDADDLMLIMPAIHSASQDRLCQAGSATMQYSNLTNEEVSDKKIYVGEEMLRSKQEGISPRIFW